MGSGLKAAPQSINRTELPRTFSHLTAFTAATRLPGPVNPINGPSSRKETALEGNRDGRLRNGKRGGTESDLTADCSDETEVIQVFNPASCFTSRSGGDSHDRSS